MKQKKFTVISCADPTHTYTQKLLTKMPGEDCHIGHQRIISMYFCLCFVNISVTVTSFLIVG